MAKWKEKKAIRREGGNDEALSSSEGNTNSGNKGEGGNISDVEHYKGLQEYKEVIDLDNSNNIEVII